MFFSHVSRECVGLSEILIAPIDTTINEKFARIVSRI